MTAKTLTVTEAVRHFSDYMNRVAYRHEAFILRKGNKAIAELRPVPAGRRLGDLPGIMRSLPQLTRVEAATFAADIKKARDTLPSAVDNPWES